MKAAMLAGACMFAAASASAQGTFGNWRVADNDKGCTASSTFEDGTTLALGYDSYAKTGLLVLTNPRWTSIEEDRKYDIQVEMPPFTAWELKATGVSLEATKGFYASFSGALLVSEFMEAEGMRLKTGRNQIGAFTLNGSYLAAIELARCNNRQLKRVKSDPFAD